MPITAAAMDQRAELLELSKIQLDISLSDLTGRSLVSAEEVGDILLDIRLLVQAARDIGATAVANI